MNRRTSITHPLEIAQISVGDSLGRVGLTFCPGKHQESAMSGPWSRDLDLDLDFDAIEAWGAAAVLTLVEDHELEQLGVARMGLRQRASGWPRPVAEHWY